MEGTRQVLFLFQNGSSSIAAAAVLFLLWYVLTVEKLESGKEDGYLELEMFWKINVGNICWLLNMIERVKILSSFYKFKATHASY